MEMMTITQVSKTFNVSTRMIRYYEKIGLLSSYHREEYAYRMYDETAIMYLLQIIMLRKLRIPLKQIAVIFDDEEQVETLRIFQENILEIDQEISALSKIRELLGIFVAQLQISVPMKKRLDFIEDAELVKIIDTLSLSKKYLKEERFMNEVNKVSGQQLNVRMVLLPACTVASYHYIGENPEETTGDQINQFVQESKLYEKKPDARMFGFNHPNPSEGQAQYGYEVWVTIPDDMKVPAPLEKKHFEGGLYAAHTINFPDFHEWKLLVEWVKKSDLYAENYSKRGSEIMGGCLEEHLNWIYSSHMGWPENGIDGKIDLLLPVKQK